MPVDAKIADKFDNDANTQIVAIDEIPEGWMGLDVGPKTQKDVAEILNKSKLILWNGYMGVFELSSFAEGTISAAQNIAKATSNGAFL